MPTDTRVFEFADFRIDVEERVLYRGDDPVRLAPKVFDTLFALVTRAGKVVPKDTLMEEIWQTTFVEENNLTQHIFTLRRVLGEAKGGTKFIETIPRRGYRFLPPVTMAGDGEREVPDLDNPGETQRAATAIDVQSDLGRTTIESSPTIGNTIGSSIAPSRRPIGRAILLVGLVVVALIGTFGFALRSSWNSSDASNVRLLRLTESGNAWGASISPDGKSLAYVIREGTTHSLRLKNIQNGSEVVVVPPTEVRLGNPRFSQEGDFIFISRDHEVYRLPLFGGEWLKVASNLWSNFSVSPDGKQIAFPRAATPNGETSVVVANSDGSGDRIVATATNPDFYLGWGPSPVFSPDGERLTAIKGRHGSGEVKIIEIDPETGNDRDLEMDAVWDAVEYVDWRASDELLIAGRKKGDDATQIWRVKFPSGSVDRVTNDLSNYLSFTLSGDKNQIVAIQESENLHLWRFDPETGASQQITSGPSRSEGRYGLSYAPDGRIVFTARDKNNFDVYSVKDDGGELMQLTKNAGRNSDAVVSPNNELIAFVSDRTGAERLWLMNRDGSEPRQLTASNETDIAESSPYFSQDGLWIYYVSRRSGQGSIRRISVRGGEPESVGVTDVTADKPVLSPDGKLLAYGTYNKEATAPWQVTVGSQNNSGTERSFDIPAFRSRVRWTLDSMSLIAVDDRTGGYNLRMTNLGDGNRRAITNFKTDKIYRFDVSPDRRSYVLARGDYFYDAVLIER